MSRRIGDIDDYLADLDDELEARFQELEQRADLDEVRAKMAQEDARRQGNAWAQPAGQVPPRAEPTRPSPPPHGPDDPLRDLKSAFTAGPQASPRELLLVLCPACGRKNRLDRRRAASEDPRCGACGANLVFTR